MIGPPASVIIDRIRNGSLSPLIINLYSLERGYSVVFPASDDRKWTTRCFSYEDESELLDDVEKGRLPLFLIDLIDQYCTSTGSDRSPIYTEGCIGVEVRDFRRRSERQEATTANDKEYDVSYSVLRPTAATLMNDLERLQYGLFCMEKRRETEKSAERPNAMESAESIFNRRARYENERLNLESDFWRLVGSNATTASGSESSGRVRRYTDWPYRQQRYDLQAKRRREARLCLEQHFPVTQWIINNTVPGKRIAPFTLTPNGEQPRPLAITPSAGASQWKPMMPTMVKTPLEIAERRLQRAQVQQEQQQSECVDGMELMEEYGIELPSAKQKTHTRIRIYKRCLDSVYVGHLRMEREDLSAKSSLDGIEAQEVEPDSVSECSFLLGSEAGSRSYIRQYLDMVSEGGRRQLTLTRRVPGKPPQVFLPRCKYHSYVV